jgi:hypothetical protein
MALCFDYDELCSGKWLNNSGNETAQDTQCESESITLMSSPKSSSIENKDLKETHKEESITVRDSSRGKRILSKFKKTDTKEGGTVGLLSKLSRQNRSQSNDRGTSQCSINGVDCINGEKKKGAKTKRRFPFKRGRQGATEIKTESYSSPEVLTDGGSSVCETIAREFPTLTQSERKRFISGRSIERARDKMAKYVEWRTRYNIDTAHSIKDEVIWNHAASFAAKHVGFKLKDPMPRILRFGESFDWTSKNGNRVVQVLPGLIDTAIAPLEVYVLCSSLYLDLKLDRNSMEQIVVLVDVRAGIGWPNPPPTSLIPFAKQLSKCLADIMPERLSLCAVYPVPNPAKIVWAIFKGFLDAKHVQKIQIFWGMARATSPAPVKQMQHFFHDDVIEGTETSRKSEFM